MLHISCVTVERPMKNITLAVDDDVLDRARLVAAQKRTTVNAMVRNFLAEVGEREDRIAEARRQLRHLMDASEGRMAPGWRFDRDETHER
jgi:Arc/MetJ family transcription regulator